MMGGGGGGGGGGTGGGGGGGGGGTVTWAPTPTQQQGTEIDRIMAKIEQARLSLANVCVLHLETKQKLTLYLFDATCCNLYVLVTAAEKRDRMRCWRVGRNVENDATLTSNILIISSLTRCQNQDFLIC